MGKCFNAAVCHLVLKLALLVVKPLPPGRGGASAFPSRLSPACPATTAGAVSSPTLLTLCLYPFLVVSTALPLHGHILGQPTDFSLL